MASYRTHVSVNLFLGLPLTLAALKYSVQSSYIDTFSFAAAFIYGTFFLHPDLDLARQIRLFSLKGLLTLPFRPYSYFFKHRGISHVPIVGTLTRVLWLMAFFYLIYFSLGWTFPALSFWNQPFLFFALAGFASADFIHFLLDH